MHGFWHIAILGIFWGLGVWCLWKEKRGSVALFYALVAVTATYPLAFSPGYLPANAPAANDAYLFLWDLWWVRFSLLQFSNPLYTDYLFAPHGTTLVFHGLALLQALVTLPLQALGDGLTGLTVAYAGVVLLSFWLAGWATYLLAMYVTGHRMGSIVAGPGLHAFQPPLREHRAIPCSVHRVVAALPAGAPPRVRERTRSRWHLARSRFRGCFLLLDRVRLLSRPRDPDPRNLRARLARRPGAEPRALVA